MLTHNTISTQPSIVLGQSKAILLVIFGYKSYQLPLCSQQVSLFSPTKRISQLRLWCVEKSP